MAFHALESPCVFFPCLPVFVAKCILESHQPFCFLFTVTENMLRKKSFGTRLDFGEMLLREQNGNPEYRSILPAWVANQNTEFAASCPLAELAL